MIWSRFLWLFILFILGQHICFPSRYLELADSADFFIARQNWDKAEEAIIKALREEPANFSNSLLLANLGLVQTQKGEYNKALESLSMGLNIAPSSTVLLNNRAHTYLLLDNIDNAIKDLDKSLEIDSLQEWSLQTRAYLYLQNENLVKARHMFERLREIFPPNPSVYSGLATIDENEGNIDNAIKNYKKAIELNPEDNETREAYIFLLINSDKYSEARIVLRESIELNPENPMYYLLRGYLHKLNFRLDEAAADKKIAIAKGIPPDYAAKFIP